MIRKLTLSLTALATAALLTAGPVLAQEAETPAIPDIPFSFDGPFGTYNQHQLQRGLQVYTEVCSACHGLDLVAIRTLGDEGGPHLSQAQVKAYAAAFPVNDTASNPQLLDSSGNARKLIPSDHFPSNNMMGAPDLSVMAKARAAFHGPYKLGINQLIHGIGGPQYIVALLTGFTDKTKDLAGSTVYQNHFFPGGWIRMPPPLSDGQVTFADGSPNDLKHEAEDVAAFLMWAAEPHQDARKHAGFDAVYLLIILTSLLYLTNKRLWAGVKGKKKTEA
jgi:ubiquinol-cytochrome c reductase cytochrome c1 subunit